MGRLTGHVVDPHRLLQGENVVSTHQEIEALIEDEVMPGLGNIIGLVEYDHGKNDLRDDDCNARGGCNPGVDIGDSTGIAL